MFGQSNVDDEVIKKRREAVFIVLSGFFLGTLAILNILGISRQIDLSFTLFGRTIPFIVFVGVLPYPITFLCTDFICELYGKKRATMVVWTGLVLNIWVLFILWLGGTLPPHPELGPDNLPLIGDSQRTFFQIRQWTFGATIASMIAYLTAQFVDVHIFHLIKKLTKGKALWLRNNGSTLTSQMVDSIAVVTITWLFAKSAITFEPGRTAIHAIIILILSNYVFKMVSALLDTIPFYIGTNYLSRYLQIDTIREYRETDSEQ
ncbi:MAG TPA: queuosine precursor transporter [Bacteroidales bacterium]|nr:queuosine precursor transporter [Bacteroidales bacterium]